MEQPSRTTDAELKSKDSLLSDLHLNFGHHVLRDISSHMGNQDHLQDLTVTVEDSQIRCNSIILSACSDYFRVALTTEMKEKATSAIKLEDICKETFQTMYDMLVSGRVLLDRSNVVDVWLAADRFQIKCLFELCEEFIIKTMDEDNYIPLYNHAKRLLSVKIEKRCQHFMEKHFELFRLTDEFQNLEYKDLLSIIKSTELNVKNEDHVVDSILSWVQHYPADDQSEEDEQNCEIDVHQSDNDISADNLLEEENITEQVTKADDDDVSEGDRPSSCKGSSNENKNAPTRKRMNNRMVHLASLLASCRLGVVSRECLQRIVELTASELNTQAHGVEQCSLPWANWSANPRKFSDLDSGIVCRQEDKLFYYSCSEKRRYILTNVPGNKESSDSLFSAGSGNGLTFYFTRQRNSYNNICVVSTLKCTNSSICFEKISVLSYCEHFDFERLYFIDTCYNRVFIIDRSCRQVSYARLRPEIHVHNMDHLPLKTMIGSITGTAPCNNQQLIFFSIIKNDMEFTQVECLHLDKDQSYILDLIEGPANGIVVFADGTNKYLLQTNGALWKLENKLLDDMRLDLAFQTRLWDTEPRQDLCGARVFGRSLIIFLSTLNAQETDHLPQTAPEFFENIEYVRILEAKKCWPFTLPKSILNP